MTSTELWSGRNRHTGTTVTLTSWPRDDHKVDLQLKIGTEILCGTADINLVSDVIAILDEYAVKFNLAPKSTHDVDPGSTNSE